MDTPPLEEFLQKPEPFPSMSTPHHRCSTATTTRLRRHTITRPDSALALLSDFDDEDDDMDHEGDDQDNSGNEETFDRISGILNNLLQEANEAVNRDHHSIEDDDDDQYEDDDDDEEEEEIETVKGIQDNNEMQQQLPPPLIQPAPPSSHHEYKQTPPLQPPPPSRLPRRQLFRPSALLLQQRTRGSSVSSSSSTSSIHSLEEEEQVSSPSLFSPSSPTSSIATSPTISIGPSTPLPLSPNNNNKPTVAAIVKKSSYRKPPAARPLSCPMLSTTLRRSTTPIPSSSSRRRSSSTIPPILRDPLVESYKRLDSSMALVESLSRDLASLEKDDDNDKEEAQEKESAIRLIRHFGNDHGDDENHAAAMTAARNMITQATKNQQKVKNGSMVDPRLSALLVLPFLHIPHTLISMVFDSMSTTEPHHLTGMIAWAFLFAFANVMVDRVVISTTRPVQWLRRLSVPGAYDDDTTSSNKPTKHCSSTTRGQQVFFQRRSSRRVILPRRASVYRRMIQQRTAPLLHDAMRHGDSSSLYTLEKQQHYAALTRSRTQPGYNHQYHSNNNNQYYYANNAMTSPLSITTGPPTPVIMTNSMTSASLRPILHRRNSF